jgi:hypothetical protein
VNTHGQRSIAAGLFAICLAASASARSHRPHFEPTDLELEDSGTAEFDLQLGPAFGANGNRLIIPDFEFDLGILPNVEVEVDATLAIDGYDSTHPHLHGEAIWTAAKLGLFDSGDSAGRRIAAGLQLGPRLPTVGTKGIGYAGLALVGFAWRGIHLAGNAGGIIDPGPQITSGQATSLVAGVGLDLDLDQRNLWSLLSNVATSYYLSPDPNELTVSCGAAYNVTPSLELSLIALVGLLPGGDRAAILFGVSPKVALW